ncbi:hypothetical protein [Luteolibacter sp. LG18]|uniref:hypothetical protein n=1 Tax=Luteolibacter sp. LG18 TaxID=2819286 RepID=UPI002B2FDEE9|nr:hypothetical protein llg_11450 [Luteolibacter sp. LG18]
MSTRDPNAYFTFTLPTASEVPAGAVLHPRHSRGAVASLILGITGGLLVVYGIGFLLAVIGIICGITGLLTVKKGGGRIRGRGLAIAGLSLAVATLIGGAFWFRSGNSSETPPAPVPVRSYPAPKPAPKNAF